MKCVICGGQEIEGKDIEEEIKRGADVVFFPVRVLVCRDCGERYYDRRTMHFLEDMERKIQNNELSLHPVGKVLKP